MKILFPILVSAFIITNILLPRQANAQSPEKMKYQAVIRNSNGQVVTDQSVGMQISILQGSPTGTAVYVETQTPTSNTNGLIATEIGAGTVVSGNFTTIDWANGPYFMKIETDPTGGTNYTITGTNQLLSVPFALYAKTAESLTDIDSFSWSTTGNAGTDAATNFIGTIDNQPLIFKVNNVQAGKISSGNNTFYGLESGVSNTIGVVNTANGYQALYSNTTGNHNTAIGNKALFENTAGQRNTAMGSGALQKNETGNDNTAIGFTSLLNNIDGNENTAIGKTALYSNTTGDYNTAIGKSALYYNTTGHSNTAIGRRALVSNTVISNLVAIGDSALFNNGIGSNGNTYYATENTALGSKSLYSNTTGYKNTASGNNALYTNTTGSSNTANGSKALYSNTSGYENTSIGRTSLYLNSSGVQNTAVGAEALYSNIGGFYNTAIGRGALHSNTSANGNSAIGRSSLFSNTTGYNNTAIGHVSLYDNSSGYENTAVGTFALYNTTTAGRNVGVGYEAGFNNSTGFYNTAVGWGSGPNTWNHKNTTAIGRGATTTAWNQVRIGNNIVTSIGGYTGWSNISDKRFKKAIKNDIIGLDFIMALQPVSYQLDMEKLEKSTGNNRHASDSSYKETKEEREFNLQSKIEKGQIRQSGFLAQDVEQAANSVGYDFSGVDKPKNEDDFYGLRYAEFVVPLVKGMQEQQLLIEELTNENKQIKDELAQIKLLLNKNAHK